MNNENYLDCFTIVSLPHLQQKIALSLLSINKGSAEEISRDIKTDEQNTVIALESLVDKEYIVKKPSEDNIFYCLRE